MHLKITFTILVLAVGCNGKEEVAKTVPSQPSTQNDVNPMPEDDGMFPKNDLRSYPHVTSEALSSLVSGEDINNAYGEAGKVAVTQEGKAWKFEWLGPGSKSGEILIAVEAKSKDSVDMAVASRKAIVSTEGRIAEVELPDLGVLAFWNPDRRFRELEVFTAEKRISISTGLMFSSRDTSESVTKTAAISLAKCLLVEK